MSEQLRKPPRKPKSKKITLNKNKHWKDIINNVEKKEVPIEMVQQIIVKLVDGTETLIDIKKLLDEDGLDATEIEIMLDLKFDELDAYIDNVDFLIDVDKIVSTVQPETDRVLKDL
jgi:hypothetical protein